METLLLDEDIEYINKLGAWIKSSLEYSVFCSSQLGNDVLLIRDIPPCSLFFGKFNCCFVSLNEAIDVCEELALNRMIYEAFLDSALENAYTLSNMMDTCDAERFISYFKIHHHIVDEDLLSEKAAESIKESSKLLYA